MHQDHAPGGRQGVENASPQTVLEVMGTEGVRRSAVAARLQQYRAQLEIHAPPSLLPCEPPPPSHPTEP